jgi:hypothetical protein
MLMILVAGCGIGFSSNNLQVLMLSNFLPSSLMARPNKLEGSSLETFSSQVLGFEVKARANPIGTHFRCFLLG